jgi:hypothetical protein
MAAARDINGRDMRHQLGFKNFAGGTGDFSEVAVKVNMVHVT